MGLLELLNPGISSNPIYSGLNNNRSALAGMFLGGVGAQDPRAAIRGAAQGLQQGAQADTGYAVQQRAEQERQKQIAQQQEQQTRTMQWLQQNKPELVPLLQSGASPMDVMKMALTPATGQNETFFGTPIPYRTPDGVGYGQISNTNEFKPITLPEGASFAPKTTTVDLGNMISVQDQFGNELYKMPKGGTPPASYQMDQSGASMAPTPGSPAAQDVIDAKNKELTRKTAIQQAGHTVLREVSRSLDFLAQMNQDGGFVGASVRGTQQNVPGTPEFNFKKQIESALSNVGLDRLQQMRESSPTGGALGQVPIQQQKRLEQVLGSFDLTQQPEILKENLNNLHNTYLDIMFGSKAERAAAVEQGKMTKAESDQIDSMYKPVAYDIYGNKVNSTSAPASGQTFTYNPATGQLE